MDKRAELKARVNRGLDSAVSEAEFDWAFGQMFTPADDLESLSDDDLTLQSSEMATLIEKARRVYGALQPRSTKAPVPLDPPHWWVAESHDVLASLLSERARLLRAVGLESTVTLAEVAPLLKQLAASDGDARSAVGLEMPVEDVSRLHMDGALSYPCEILWIGGQQPDTQPPIRAEYLALTGSPLYQLHVRTKALAAATGFRQAQIIAFLLCDRPSTRPWIQLDLTLSTVPQLEPRVSITVPIRRVSPGLVAAVTRYLQGLMRQELGGEVRRSRGDSRSVLYRWVRERTERNPEEGWRERHQAWEQALARGELDPGAVSYRNARVMSSAYNQRRNEVETHKGGFGS